MLNQIFRFAKRKGYISDPPVMTSGLRGSFAKWLGARARQLLPQRGKFLALLAHGFEQLSRVLRPQFHKLRRLLSAGDALTGLFWTRHCERMGYQRSLEMPRKRFSAEQIVVLLRQIEVLMSQGKACQEAEISQQRAS